MTEQYVQINIGRGELSHEDWDEFQNDTFRALRQSVRGDTPTAAEQHDGAGWWDEATEDSTHISIVAVVDTYALRAKLTELKSKYNQDTIELIMGSEPI